MSAAAAKKDSPSNSDNAVMRFGGGTPLKPRRGRGLPRENTIGSDTKACRSTAFRCCFLTMCCKRREKLNNWRSSCDIEGKNFTKLQHQSPANQRPGRILTVVLMQVRRGAVLLFNKKSRPSCIARQCHAVHLLRLKPSDINFQSCRLKGATGIGPWTSSSKFRSTTPELTTTEDLEMACGHGERKSDS